ncbi:hypothetical protein DL764_010689 [Monosporascus ibericus]|uniref:Diphthine--ammonia ligase n=1 Tax=Monosporascus ibericus TaxID=155417 RepID=A0A4Q4SUM4_9PEZI|nr:hypothetical protein DL764_010689 [Monosporascus ibericus]
MTEGALNVIALVSGGKDSFFSILHCLTNGHRVVALANLYPPPSSSAATATRRPSQGAPGSQQCAFPPGVRAQDDQGDEDEADLNSFMYQTVGHQVIPLYAQATGLPLFRHPIEGTAVCHGLSYQYQRREIKPAATTEPEAVPRPGLSATSSCQQGPGCQTAEDETESLIPLLRDVLRAHPDANALSTGAILSTYQRTRVESVALRLGLVPLSFLWQFPDLPLGQNFGANDALGKGSSITGQQEPCRGDAQLLRDMAAAGLDARIIKVASAGLDDTFLWENVATEAGVRRVKRAMRRFGGGGRGSVLGEGGEFETLVVDGPPSLFKGRVVVREENTRVVREGGGSVWLSIRDAAVQMKRKASLEETDVKDSSIRIPGLLDPMFEATLQALSKIDELGHDDFILGSQPQLPCLTGLPASDSTRQWHFFGSNGDQDQGGVEAQTARVVADIRLQLQQQAQSASAITNAVIILKRMSDFPTINKLYGSLFEEPNPASRITISCGDALPEGCSIAVYLTVYTRRDGDPASRRGLHVQSRSYWAPANIGPYSQAITVPLLTPPPAQDDIDGQDRTRQHHGASISLAVSIAGQIPLIPASMALPDAEDTPLHITLALQHLWRVAAATEVQWWSSAVAYFPRSPNSADIRRRVALAAAAWRSAHLWGTESSSSSAPSPSEEAGPDLWDRKYNTAYQFFVEGTDEETHSVPDWEVLAGFDADDSGEATKWRRRCLPFMFAAEVEELPRSAGVEWHAHLGLAKVGAGSVRVFSSSGSSARTVELHHVVVDTASGVFVQTAATMPWAGTGTAQGLDAAVLDVGRAVARSLSRMTGSADDDPSLIDDPASPHLLYADAETFPMVPAAAQDWRAIVPCRSIWDSCGERLSMVAIFQSRFRTGNR